MFPWVSGINNFLGIWSIELGLPEKKRFFPGDSRHSAGRVRNTCFPAWFVGSNRGRSFGTVADATVEEDGLGWVEDAGRREGGREGEDGGRREGGKDGWKEEGRKKGDGGREGKIKLFKMSQGNITNKNTK